MSQPPELLYDNRFADGAIVASSTAAGTAAANLADWRTYTRWASADTAAQTVTVDCGAAAAADAFALVGHNLASAGASVAVECSSDNFAADVTVARAAAPVAADGVLYDSFAQQSKRYWRIVITGLTQAASIAAAVIGARLVFDQPIMGEFAPVTELPRYAAEAPDRGQGLAGVVAFTALSARVGFQLVDDAWFRTVFMPVWDARLRHGLPFIWTPNQLICPSDAYLMWLAPGADLNGAYHPGTWLRRFELSMQGVRL